VGAALQAREDEAMPGSETSMMEATSERSARPRKQWSDFTPRQKAAIVAGAIAELVMTAVALNDLAHRPAKDVRGSKVFWVLSFVVQPFGPLLYFLVGRRPRS
jgi:hypothetical protein